MGDFFEELEKNSVDTNKEIKYIKDNSNKNIISSIIKVICWLTIIIGFIIGISLYAINEDALEMIISWFIYFGCSIGGFAVAEIIQILHDIRNKLYSDKKE